MQPVYFFHPFSFVFTSRTQTGVRVYDFSLFVCNPAAAVPVTKEFQLRVHLGGETGTVIAGRLPLAQCVYIFMVSKITDILHFTNCVTRTHTHTSLTLRSHCIILYYRGSGVRVCVLEHCVWSLRRSLELRQPL